MTSVADDVAAALTEAARSRRPVPPPAETWPALTLADAYAAQLATVGHRLAAGATVQGRKIGLTSEAMQRLLGIDTPDFGHLLSDMQITDGATVPIDQFIAPRAEIEIAFLLGGPLRGPGVTAAAVRAATTEVRAAIEIIDSRVEDWRIGLLDTVADNASSGAYVVAGSGRTLDAVDLPAIAGELRINGSVVAAGRGAAVLGDPVRAVVWLVEALAQFGEGLRPGEVVLSGACTTALPVRAGDLVEASFEGLGTASVRFA
jgi:2-oxopent-4-enoate hydratase